MIASVVQRIGERVSKGHTAILYSYIPRLIGVREQTWFIIDHLVHTNFIFRTMKGHLTHLRTLVLHRSGRLVDDLIGYVFLILKQSVKVAMYLTWS